MTVIWVIMIRGASSSAIRIPGVLRFLLGFVRIVTFLGVFVWVSGRFFAFLTSFDCVANFPFSLLVSCCELCQVLSFLLKVFECLPSEVGSFICCFPFCFCS